MSRVPLLAIVCTCAYGCKRPFDPRGGPHMPEIRTPKAAAEDLTKLAKDAFYVSIGLAVIAFQKAQVQRQELRKQVSGQVDDAKAQLQSLSKRFEDRVKVVEERLEGVESRFETLLDQRDERRAEQ